LECKDVVGAFANSYIGCVLGQTGLISYFREF
jgi:hypothetical protein